MKRLAIVALAIAASCSTAVIRGVQRAESPDRLLEMSASYYMPPGAFAQYVVHEVAGRVEGYTFDPNVPSERTPIASSPALARYIDRVDSLIVHRLPSDTNRTLGPNQREICGDGFSYGARLTIGASVRTVGARSCGDNAPGSSGRTIVLQGILDSLAKLTRSR
jgi:hypothetical protein